MSEEEQRPAPIEEPICPNCGSALQGQFCFSCGQNQKPPDRFFLHILNEAFEGVFSVNSRAARTLFDLWFKPGFLTVEYFAGRRARYVQPLRLYLICSVVFFFFISMATLLNPDADRIIITDDDGQKDVSELLADIDASLDKFHIDFFTTEQNQSLQKAIRSQSEKAIRTYEEDPGQLAEEFIDLIPPIMFLLLPVFALVLKLVYLGSGCYYTEHLILAVHNHSFLFIALLVSEILEILTNSTTAIVTVPLEAIVEVWIPFYMYWCLKVAYGQGLFVTLLKYIFLSVSYFCLILSCLLFAFLWGVMML